MSPMAMSGQEMWQYLPLYTFFKVFDAVCSNAYNWLFVDVVPQSHMGRFMSLLRVATLLGCFVFNYYLMGLADTHLKEIILGVAGVYAVGFGVVCWKVREQPQPPSLEEVAPTAVFGSGPRVFRHLLQQALLSMDLFRQPPLWMVRIGRQPIRSALHA